MKTRAARRVGDVVVALLAALVGGVLVVGVAACSTGIASRPKTRSGVCGTLLRVSAAASDPNRTGNRAEFGDGEDLLDANSLYDTSWGLQIDAMRKSFPTSLNKRAAVSWLLAQLRDAETMSGPYAGSGVESVGEVLRGLSALGALDAVKGDPFSHFESGWGYSDAHDEAPDPGLTAIALEGLASIDRRPPSVAVAHLTQSAVDLPPGTSSLEFVDNGLAIAQALSSIEEGSQLRATVPHLERTLVQWRHAVLASGVGGLQLGILRSIDSVGARAGLAVLPPPRKWAMVLRARGGLLALSRGGAGDFQVTFDALELGLLKKRSAMPALDVGVTRSGWATFSRPTLASFYQATALRQTCQSALPVVGAQLKRWTRSVLDDTEPTSAALYEICTLHSVYKIPLTPHEQQVLMGKSQRALASLSEQKLLSVSSEAEAFFAARSCGVNANVHRLPPADLNPRTSTMVDSYAAFLLDKVGTGHRFKHAISQFLRSSRVGDGYGYKPGASTPDVFSTGFALDIRHASKSARLATLKQFRGQGAWLLEVPTREYPQKEATLASLLQVAFIATGESGRNGLNPLFLN